MERLAACKSLECPPKSIVIPIEKPAGYRKFQKRVGMAASSDRTQRDSMLREKLLGFDSAPPRWHPTPRAVRAFE